MAFHVRTVGVSVSTRESLVQETFSTDTRRFSIVQSSVSAAEEYHQYPEAIQGALDVVIAVTRKVARLELQANEIGSFVAYVPGLIFQRIVHRR